MIGEIKYPSFVFDMDDVEYHATKGHLSSSGCRELISNPRRWKLNQDRKFEREATPAMIFGTAVHAALLQPREYDNLVAITPAGINRRTSAGREEYAAWAEDNKGKALITEDMNNQIADIQDSISQHELASYYLGCLSNTEVAAFFEVQPNVNGKALFDGLNLADDLLVDLKTTKSADPNQFNRSVVNFGYHIQAAYYSDAYEKVTGRPAKAFIFVAVEKEPPYSIGVYELTPEFLEAGRATYRQAASIMAYCEKHNFWPDYNKNELVLLEPPAWMEY